MQDQNQLKNLLTRIDGKGYKAYKDIKGSYQFDQYVLHIDHVQGDPFATPSRIRLTVSKDINGFPQSLFDNKYKNIALTDFIARTISNNIYKYYKQVNGSGKSGILIIDRCGQEILKRSAVIIDNKKIEARMEVGLPAAGRRILSHQAIKIFYEYMPLIVENSMLYNKINIDKLKKQIELMEDQQFIRENLKNKGLVGFISNDSILPRESGVSQKPLQSSPKAFKSPESMEVEFALPNNGVIRGMGIPEGITLIVGGGYHGKSTLLNAIQLGVYNHIGGDGREFVITRDDAAKIRAEDGRSIENVDICTFINNLPNGKSTEAFASENASGSTSQAANIIEAIEGHSELLLIDEDTSATNFMIRDIRMEKLVSKEKEPITPFIDRIRDLYIQRGISSIVVIGGCGDYFDVADKVIMMDEYTPLDVTKTATEIAKSIPIVRKGLKDTDIKLRTRSFNSKTFKDTYDRIKVKSQSNRSIIYDRMEIDLTYVEQLMDSSQTRCIAEIMKYIHRNKSKYNNCSILEMIEDLWTLMDEEGFNSISTLKGHPGNLAIPRKQEILATLNRYRELKVNI